MTEPQRHICQLVEEYKRVFSGEYQQFLNGVKQRQDKFSDNKFGKMKDVDIIDRPLLEYPETLWTIFDKTLSPESLAYLTTKEGARWLGKTYKEFLLVTI